ncbi:MAG: hypothetical protein ACYC6A_24295 [Armatimonadota bacterium]
MTRRNSTEERELLDPALSALLQETFRDDPALEPAPGRTERIMRTVLAAEKRKPAAPFWASLVWGFGATATAALLLALLLGLGGMWKPAEMAGVDRKPVVTPDQKQQQAPVFKVDDITHIAKGIGNPAPEPAHRNMPDPDLKFEEREHRNNIVPRQEPNVPQTPKTPVVPPAPSKDEVVVAAVLYEAGTTAYHTGDYETAYQAFHDSYDTVPTPEAALSTGKVLLDLARQELAPETTGEV